MIRRAGYSTEQNTRVLSTPVTDLHGGASYILNQVFQVIVNVFIFQTLLCWKRPAEITGKQREAECLTEK